MTCDGDTVLRALRQKLQLFKDMMTISTKQLEFLNTFDVAKDSFEQMEGLFRVREKIRLNVDDLEKKIRGYFRGMGINDLVYKEIRGKLTPEHYQGYVQFNDEIAKLIAAIQTNDHQALAKMKVLMGETGIKINQAREQKKAFNAYMQYDSYPEAWFFDKKK